MTTDSPERLGAEVIEGYNKEKGLKPKDTYMPLRVAVTGKKESPGLFETIEVLGKEIVRRRVRMAISLMGYEPYPCCRLGAGNVT